ncbi:MAG: hypothetical protein KatS3mg111_4301 [Pirellulaceae bacterium]|nr:MAG: hypothetical protein KatS3mg111_4301 [Pirellulaceae bacterium]
MRRGASPSGCSGVGIVVSLLKGFDYEEATILLVLLLALLPCRKHFYRRGQLLAPKLTVGWIATIVISLGLILWVVLFAYRHVEYRDSLWWDFAYHGDAPRSLRGLVSWCCSDNCSGCRRSRVAVSPQRA